MVLHVRNEFRVILSYLYIGFCIFELLKPASLGKILYFYPHGK